MKRILLAMIFAAISWPGMAVEPDEILADHALEARARDISKHVRCMVCQNESIDDSNADLARDLRILIREKLVEDWSDQEIYQFIVDRYGDFALLEPRKNGINIGLYLSGPVFLLLAIFICTGYWRRRYRILDKEKNELDPDEKNQLKILMKSD